jgi:ribose 5-phosphate isomerase A
MADTDSRAADHERAVRAAATAALQYVEPRVLLGVGSGRTVAAFIELLADSDRRPSAAVASSLATAELLRIIGVDAVPLPASGRLPIYVDGADAADGRLRLIKGRGGAHTREKVLASASDRFVCIVDDSKPLDSLEGHTVPLEVLPIALDFVLRELSVSGARGVLREGGPADNGGLLLDVEGLDLGDPERLECRLECIPGVIGCGVFAHRCADVLLIGRADGSAELRLP